MAFTDLDLMNVIDSEINRFVDIDKRQIKRLPTLDDSEGGDYQFLLESLMEK